ncbi:DUF2798 domain-containing protein [Pontibacter qinzhouensis]|uniref:DUF2798 domain-containing protein n=1 Tax=Pontibacter qinzhouensis TaxID=2603253 RepID=A0A5C8JJU0_9BACT|nr:DUF2798 domain-containing protein [Pontibacter qinzhouensis]TXK36944.1 DUF2798 domain-containing protein [Pontibacter qinzhouensis]
MNKKYLRHIQTLFVVLPMTLIMAFVGIARNYGFVEDWGYKLIHSWTAMVPVAYITAFFIIPFAKKLAERVAARP